MLSARSCDLCIGRNDQVTGFTVSPSRMLGRLIPKDQEFFTLFNELANHLLTSARLLRELFDDSTRLQENLERIQPLLES